MSETIIDDGVTLRARDIELYLWADFDITPIVAETHRICLLKDRRFLSSLCAVLDRIAPLRVVEIGIFQGGSSIYWLERYGLKKLTTFDLADNAPALVDYIVRHALGERLQPHFGVSQDDRTALRAAVAADFGDDLVDVVIDDASHLYDPTITSLETLLPFVRPGGAYVIEDWFWPPLRPLMAELPMLLWGRDGIIDRLEIDKSFVVLWRGDTPLPRDGSFKLFV